MLGRLSTVYRAAEPRRGCSARALPHCALSVRILTCLIGRAGALTWLTGGLVRAGGAAVFAFAAVGVYLFFGALAVATGGRPLPLGQPVLR